MPAHPPPPPPVRAAAAAAAARGSGTSTPTSSSRRAGTHAATAAAKRAASQSAAAAKRAAAAARAAAATAAAAQEVSRHASDTPQPSSSSQSDTGESSWRYDPGTHAVGGRAPQSVYDIRSRVKLLKQVARDRIADMKAFVAVQERALVEAEGALDTRAIGTAAMATPVRGGSLVPTLTQSPSGSSEDDSLMLVDPPLRPSGGTKNRDGNDGTSSSSSSASAVAEVVAARDAVEGAQVALRELRAWLRQVKRYDASHRWMWTSTTTATTAATSSS
ncbi:hypothetical protein BC828DRAFT_407365 [Blastocladiella britannica]|nr:hypothetical protein BC828DRAFT_407365 [Blastocladiella britannica]